MRFKSLKILLIVFVGLLVIAGVWTLIQRRPTTRKPFAALDFNRVEIKAKDTLCIIEKVGEEWKLVEPIEYAVDTTAFYRFLKGLKDLEIGEVVSSREARHQDFEVNERGVEVKVHWDRGSKVLILGKMAGDFMHWYLRFPPAPETYLSKGLSKYMVDRHLDDWRDHSIFSFDPALVKELNLGEQKVVRTRPDTERVESDTVWMMGEEVIEDRQVKPILDLLSNLRADGFSTTEFTSEFEVKIIFNPSVILSDSEESPEEKILYIGSKVDNKYPAKVLGSPTVFLLNSWKIERLNLFGHR